MHIQKGVKKPTKGKNRGTEHGEQQKKPSWIATTVAEYDDGREPSTEDEQDELASPDEDSEGSSNDDVQVCGLTVISDVLTCVAQIVASLEGKGKGAVSKGRGRGTKSHARDDDGIGSKSGSRGRAMLRNLPNDVRSIVTKANIFLRLRMSLENAWTSEKKYSHAMLPEKHSIAKRAIGDIWELHDDDRNPFKHLDIGFKILNNDKNEELRQDVFNLVSVSSSAFTALMIAIAL